MKDKDSLKEIAFRDHTSAHEDLPLPIVLYPGHYGTFFGFRQTEDSPIVLCSCAKEAIESYLKFRLSTPIPLNVDPARMFILDSMNFSKTLVGTLMKRGVQNDYEVINHLVFENKLCHECNGLVPKYRYCHEMYGGAFLQNYGWYINKQAYEFGVEPISNRTIPEICPQEILELIKLDPIETPKRCHELLETNSAEADKLWKEFQKQNRKVWNIIENEVRLKCGHRKIGEAWTSETILYYIVRSLFPDMTVQRHYRPDFLQGLELDIFIKELKVGVEYQGVQHFKPIGHWGGIEALQKLKVRDRKKREICGSLGIHLVYFKYSEGLSNDLVFAKLKKYVEGL
jgi:hypothetical protein